MAYEANAPDLLKASVFFTYSIVMYFPMNFKIIQKKGVNTIETKANFQPIMKETAIPENTIPHALITIANFSPKAD